MRDAFGGEFTMRLMLVFIVILVAFTAISFKYAKSFRVKNKVIDFVEQNQIIDIDKFFSKNKNTNKLKKILNDSEYKIQCTNGNNAIKDDADRTIGYCYNGVQIIKNEEKSHDRTIVYNIYTYVNWELGSLNMILALGGQDAHSESVIGGAWQISGEAVVNY